MSTYVEPWGFVVIEAAESYEQILALDTSNGLPDGGILTWADDRKLRTFFPTRTAAREAIKRTEHYRLAFGRTDLPEKTYCRVKVIGQVRTKEQS